MLGETDRVEYRQSKSKKGDRVSGLDLISGLGYNKTNYCLHL